MKNIREKVFVFMLSLIFVIGGTFSAFAGNIKDFPAQNTGSFQSNYTRAVQAMLMDYSEDTREMIEPYGVDGSFGPATRDSLKIFQQGNRLSADGSCGPLTWKKIDDVKKRYSIGFSNGYAQYFFGGYWSKSKCYRQHNTSLDWQLL